MQITVAHKVWDNSICLDVYGKFIYMAQFSANFPVEDDRYWFLLLFFHKYFITIITLCFSAEERQYFWIHGEERAVNWMWDPSALLKLLPSLASSYNIEVSIPDY